MTGHPDGAERRSRVAWDLSLLSGIMVLAFAGALFASFPGGTAVQKVLILCLSIVALLTRSGTAIPAQAVNLLAPYLAYCVLATASAIAVSGSILYALAALQPLLLGPIVYLAIVTCGVRIDHALFLSRLFVLVCLLQIGFAFIKLAVHGIDEKVLIGSMSHAAGQLGFLFPAVAVPIVVFLLGRRHRMWMFALLAGMFVFGIINEKRSIVFLLPIVILASLVAIRSPSRRTRRRPQFGFWLITVAILVGGFLLGLRAIPSLNPDEAYGGGVNPAFAIEYAIQYLTMDYGGPLQGAREMAAQDVNIQVGRFIILLEIARWLGSVDLATLLFGAGYGLITPSDWLGGQEDRLFEVLGTRGAISGAGLAVIETGLLGLGLYVAFFLTVARTATILAKQAHTEEARTWYRIVLVLLGVFAYDFFFYSTTLFRTLPMPVLVFSVLASLSLARRLDSRAARIRERTALALIVLEGRRHAS